MQVEDHFINNDDLYTHNAIKRKIDLNILPLICILYIFSILERVNIGNARIVNFYQGQGQMERELGMSFDEYNIAVSIFFIGYVIFEVPSNLMIQWTTPRIWLTRISITWGICACSMATAINVSGFLTARFFLGVLEAGLVPGIIFYLTHWYKKNDLATRIGIFFSAASFASGLGGLIAYGISHMDGLLGLSAWRYIFLIEGIPSIVLGILVYFFLPDTAKSSKFLTTSEKEYWTELLLTEKISLEDHTIKWDQVKDTLLNIHVWLYMFIFIGLVIPASSLSVFLGTIIKSWGVESLNAQLYTFPPYLITGICVIAISHLSDKIDNRGYIICACSIFSACCILAAAFVTPDSDGNFILLYVLVTFAIIGVSCAIPICITWQSNNFTGTTVKSVSTAMVVSFGGIGGVIAGQVYRQNDTPMYRNGHLFLGACIIFSNLWTIVLIIYYKKQKYQEIDNFRFSL